MSRYVVLQRAMTTDVREVGRYSVLCYASTVYADAEDMTICCVQELS